MLEGSEVIADALVSGTLGIGVGVDDGSIAGAGAGAGVGVGVGVTSSPPPQLTMLRTRANISSDVNMVAKFLIFLQPNEENVSLLKPSPCDYGNYTPIVITKQDITLLGECIIMEHIIIIH